MPARLLKEEPPATILGHCREPVRGVQVGRGRRPGATVVVVFLHNEVLNNDAKYVSASTLKNLAEVKGDAVSMKMFVENRSLYDIGQVIIQEEFNPSPLGPEMDDIISVRGAVYNDRDRTFFIDRIESGETAVVTFQIFLRGDVREGISQSRARVLKYDVLESERRYPPRTPHTPVPRSRQTVVKAGIGMEDVVCFTKVSSNFREVETNITSGDLDIRMQANTREVKAGMSIIYTAIVRNNTDSDLRNITVDSGFDRDQIVLEERGSGEELPSGLRWVIPFLAAGDQWLARFEVRATDGVRSGESISTTLTLDSAEIRDFPLSERRVTTTISVIDGMPLTGVPLREMLLLALLAIGVLSFALILTSGGLWILVRE